MTKQILVHPRIMPDPDDLYMGLAFWHACLSKDPKIQIGSVLVSSHGEVLGIGHASPPTRINEHHISWDETGDFIICAEHNAIKRSTGELRGSTIYTTGIPCHKCVLEILDVGISRIVWHSDKPSDGISENIHNLATCGGLQIMPFGGNLNWMRDRITFMEQTGVFG
jgi:deoxycytidylate deaminase